jgi:hypothetical protein
MISTSLRYQILTSNPERTRALVESDVSVKRDTEYFKANIGKIKSIDEFMKDYRLFSYAMKAFGLSNMTYAKAFIGKVLKEGVASPDSMANRMSDPTYREFAKTFDFAGLGDKATSDAKAMAGVAEKFLVQTLEVKEGADNEGVRLSLYFKRKASSVTSYMGVLADKAILTFVQTAFGIPKAMSGADLDYQVRQLEQVFDIKDFQDPKKVEKLIQRFSAMWDMSADSPVSTSPVLSLFDSSQSDGGFGLDLMMSIAKLPKGGF